MRDEHGKGRLQTVSGVYGKGVRSKGETGSESLPWEIPLQTAPPVEQEDSRDLLSPPSGNPPPSSPGRLAFRTVSMEKIPVPAILQPVFLIYTSLLWAILSFRWGSGRRTELLTKSLVLSHLPCPASVQVLMCMT